MNAASNAGILDRPISLLRFLAMWLATYLLPGAVTFAVASTVLWAGIESHRVSAKYASAIVWLCLFPSGIAVGQWMLMRRYIARPGVWSAATFVGALLSQLTDIIVVQLSLGSLVSSPQLHHAFDTVWPGYGRLAAALILRMLPVALCQGIAWSVPQGLALPSPWSGKLVWIVAVAVTVFVIENVTVVLQFILQLVLGPPLGPSGLVTAVSVALPAILGWCALSTVSGSIMFWCLRRNSSGGQGIFSRFD